MLTRYILTIGDERHELSDEDLRNWDQIQISYKRAAVDGVVRSFSSQFEFVNRAKDLLWSAYLAGGVNTSASVTMCVFTDNMTWEERFTCPLDFSTLEIESFALRLNCVDNSLAALIKANKSTKYEFVVGKDIATGSMFRFDRLPMNETATYKFSKGYSDEETGRITARFTSNVAWVGNVGSEIAVNRVLYFAEDQEDTEGSYILKAYAPVEVTAHA